MSLDASLKFGSGLVKHRNVLTRAERVERLMAKGDFDSEKGRPLGMAKLGNRKLTTGKKSKKKDEES